MQLCVLLNIVEVTSMSAAVAWRPLRVKKSKQSHELCDYAPLATLLPGWPIEARLPLMFAWRSSETSSVQIKYEIWAEIGSRSPQIPTRLMLIVKWHLITENQAEGYKRAQGIFFKEGQIKILHTT